MSNNVSLWATNVWITVAFELYRILHSGWLVNVLEFWSFTNEFMVVIFCSLFFLPSHLIFLYLRTLILSFACLFILLFLPESLLSSNHFCWQRCFGCLNRVLCCVSTTNRSLLLPFLNMTFIKNYIWTI